MSVFPFIEAEKCQHRNVAKACALLVAGHVGPAVCLGGLIRECWRRDLLIA